MALPSTLIVGYGNPDRQDDGLAWHILGKLARFYKIADTDDFFPTGHNPDLLFALQLTPEMAETVARYDRVCFVDANAGENAEDISLLVVPPEYQSSPLTHHMTPQTLLSLVATLFDRNPQAVLVSVRGFEFGFARSLSENASQLAEAAFEKIVAWIQAPV